MINRYLHLSFFVSIILLFSFSNIFARDYKEITYDNGDQYKGEVENGKRQGKGIYIWAKGTGQYEGDWVNDQRTGYGVFTWRNGDRYAGEWLNSKMHGRGVYIYADGNRLEGFFANDEFVSKSDSRNQSYTNSYPNSLADAKQQYEEALATYNEAVKKLNEARQLNSLYDMSSLYYDNTTNKKDKLLGKFGQRSAQALLDNAEGEYIIAKDRLDRSKSILDNFYKR